LITGPRPRTVARGDLVDAVLLGVVSAGMTLLFFEAIARIPLATAVACGSGRDRLCAGRRDLLGRLHPPDPAGR
jgi:hypothetical protein